MKKILFLLLLLPTLVLAQVNRAVRVNGEWQNAGSGVSVYELTANNEDYCDYYFSIDLQNYGLFRNSQAHYFTSVRSGYTSIMRLTPVSQNSYQGAQYQYRTFRGNIYLDVNAEFQYALPVKTGDSIRVTAKENSDYTLIFDLSNTTTDTIYACRRGIVCNDTYTDNSAKGYNTYKSSKNQITIYHKDGSFGEYKGFSKPLVSAGENVDMGMPIAVVFSPKALSPDTLDRVIVKEIKVVTQKEASGKHIEFAVYFLDKNKVENKDTGNKHSHLRPFFHTTAGNVRLEKDVTYTCERTDEMMFQDMSKREIKKYQKNKK